MHNTLRNAHPEPDLGVFTAIGKIVEKQAVFTIICITNTLQHLDTNNTLQYRFRPLGSSIKPPHYFLNYGKLLIANSQNCGFAKIGLAQFRNSFAIPENPTNDEGSGYH
jgi:hypothetical protein